MPRHTEVRSCAYLNHIVEQDHRRVKSRVDPMLGFKRFGNAAVVITGIELAQTLRKGQINVQRLCPSEPWGMSTTCGWRCWRRKRKFLRPTSARTG